MRYAKINEAIWTDRNFNAVSDPARLLYVYLLSCSKCNSVGIFQIGLGTIEDEFRHERAEIRELLKELEGADLARFSEGWIWFNKYIKWNEPTSPNHARHCAADLHDCVMRDAPYDAVYSFLASVKAVLGNIWMQKDHDGKKRSYYDEFRGALDVVLVGDFLGGSDVLRKCIENGKSGIKKDKNNNLRASNNTGRASDNIDTNTIQLQVQDNNNTRQDNTKLSCSCESSESSEVLLFCSDGQPLAVGQAAARLALARFPEDERQRVIISAQKASMNQPVGRDNADLWFADFARGFRA